MSDEKVYTLISEEEVSEKIADIAAQINRDYEGKALHIITILKGGVFYACELAKKITVPVTFDFLCVSSYADATTSSGHIRMIKDLEEPIEGRDVLIVEDILDTGNTLHYLMKLLRERKPASLKLTTLLDKPDRRIAEDVRIDYPGFTIPDEFVVGYGMDYQQKYRNLPYIGYLKAEELTS